LTSTPVAPNSNQCESPYLEVLICTHNRVELLERTLYYLNQATRPESCNTTLFVVANACADTTHNFLSTYQESAEKEGKLPLHWMSEARPGKSNALNSALPVLKGNAIAMVDDDHRVDSQFFVQIFKALSQYPQADFFCGKIIPDWTGEEQGWVRDVGKYKIYPLPIPRFDLGDAPLQVTKDIAHPGGGNLVIKLDLFKRVGPFSNKLGPVGHNLEGAEDMQWVKRAYKLGAYLQYIPELIQYHYVDQDRLKLGYILKKAYARSCSTVRTRDDKKPYFLFPKFLLRKSLNYLALSIVKPDRAARRFYLVRLFSTLGEMKGYVLSNREDD